MASGVEFDEDKFNYGARPARPGGIPSGGMGYGRPAPASNVPKMAQWLIKKGIVKSEGAAQGLLLAVVIINIIITFVVIYYFL